MNKDKQGILYSDDWSTVIGITPGYYNDIEIKDGVTKIDSGAFKNASYIESLKLPMSLKEIGDHAFGDNIKKIYADDLLEDIAIRSGRFINMAPGSECSLPFKSVVYQVEDDGVCIGVYPVSGGKLESVVVNSSVGTITEIKCGAFDGHKGLKSVVINASIKRAIMPSAFRGCINLETFVINGNLGRGLASDEMAIREQAFEGCSSLKSLVITGTVNGKIPPISLLNCGNFDMSIDGDIIPKIDEVSLNVSKSAGVLNGIEYVDLGLPSGLKWARLNMGATSLLGAPRLYQWGMNNSDFREMGQYFAILNKIKTTEMGNLAPECDAATINCETPWRMPTEKEYLELINNCEWEKIEMPIPPIKRGVVSGVKATGPNGCSIFFPITNLKWNEPNAPYLTSTQAGDSSCKALLLRSGSIPSIILCNGIKGGIIRPVAD